MNLKKSDKLIALVAVVILIIAAIGVVLYVDREPDEESSEEEKMLLFDVEVGTIVNSINSGDFTVTKNELYTYDFEVSTDDLERFSIHVEYQDDDKALFDFVKEFRANTLTVKLLNEAGEEKDKVSFKGTENANVTMNFSSDKGALKIDTIEAKDLSDAEEKLAENITKTGETEKYTLEISVDYGEFRIIKTLLEIFKKDTFTLEITESHYDYTLVEQEQTEEENGDVVEESLMVQTYRTLGYPGFH